MAESIRAGHPARFRICEFGTPKQASLPLNHKRMYELLCRAVRLARVAQVKYLWERGQQNMSYPLTAADLREGNLFFEACFRGNSAMAEWLWKARDNAGDGLTLEDARADGCRAYRAARDQGHHAVALWLEGLAA